MAFHFHGSFEPIALSRPTSGARQYKLENEWVSPYSTQTELLESISTKEHIGGINRFALIRRGLHGEKLEKRLQVMTLTNSLQSNMTSPFKRAHTNKQLFEHASQDRKNRSSTAELRRHASIQTERQISSAIRTPRASTNSSVSPSSHASPSQLLYLGKHSADHDTHSPRSTHSTHSTHSLPFRRQSSIHIGSVVSFFTPKSDSQARRRSTWADVDPPAVVPQPLRLDVTIEDEENLKKDESEKDQLEDDWEKLWWRPVAMDEPRSQEVFNLADCQSGKDIIVAAAMERAWIRRIPACPTNSRDKSCKISQEKTSSFSGVCQSDSQKDDSFNQFSTDQFNVDTPREEKTFQDDQDECDLLSLILSEAKNAPVTGLTNLTDEQKLQIREKYMQLVRNFDDSRVKNLGNPSSPALSYIKRCCEMGIIPEPMRVFDSDDIMTGKLCLRSYLMGNNKAEAISDTLQHLRSVEKIDLRFNRIDHTGVALLLQKLQPGVRSLDIAHNRIGSKGAMAIAEFLSYSNSLTELNLEDTSLGDSGTILICQSLPENAGLRRLNLSSNEIGDKGAIALGELLSSSSPLLELYLRWNRIRGKGAVGFALGLSQNTFLETLDLSWNALGAGAIRSISFRGRFHKGDDAISALCVALESSSLLHLDLSNNQLSALECEKLATAMENNHTILGTHINGNQASIDARGFIIPKIQSNHDSVTALSELLQHVHVHQRILGHTTFRNAQMDIINDLDGDNCWLCGKWVEHRFVWRPDKVVEGNVYLHPEFDQWLPDLMTRASDGIFEVYRMVPPNHKLFYYFTVDGNPTAAIDQTRIMTTNMLKNHPPLNIQFVNTALPRESSVETRAKNTGRVLARSGTRLRVLDLSHEHNRTEDANQKTSTSRSPLTGNLVPRPPRSPPLHRDDHKRISDPKVHSLANSPDTQDKKASVSELEIKVDQNLEKEKPASPKKSPRGISIDLSLVDVNETRELARNMAFRVVPRHARVEIEASIMAKAENVWSLGDSVFASYRQDTPQFLDRCFNSDWKQCKIANFVKDPLELTNVHAILRENYTQLKDIFKYYCAVGSTDPFSITLNSFTDLISICKIPNNTSCRIKDLDTIFIATLSSKDRGIKDRSLSRAAFLEAIVRVAIAKFIRDGQTQSESVALQKLLTEHIFAYAERALASEFRYNVLYFEQVDQIFKKNMTSLKDVYHKYSGSKCRPGEPRFMSLSEFQSLIADADLTSERFTAREVYFSFVWSMMTEESEENSQEHTRMYFIEWLEALARIADAEYLTTSENDDVQCAASIISNFCEKLECVIKLVIVALQRPSDTTKRTSTRRVSLQEAAILSVSKDSASQLVNALGKNSVTHERRKSIEDGKQIPNSEKTLKLPSLASQSSPRSRIAAKVTERLPVLSESESPRNETNPELAFLESHEGEIKNTPPEQPKTSTFGPRARKTRRQSSIARLTKEQMETV